MILSFCGQNPWNNLKCHDDATKSLEAGKVGSGSQRAAEVVAVRARLQDGRAEK